MRVVKYILWLAVFLVFGRVLGGLINSGIYFLQTHSSKWHPNTEVLLTEEEVENQEYQIYSREWSFWKFEGTRYLVITRHRIPNKKARAIARREPFAKNQVVFYHGPKWLLWERFYERGHRGYY